MRRLLVLVVLLAACGSSGHKVTAATATSTTLASSTTVAPATGPPASVNGVDAEPRSDLTPGAADPAVTQANIASTICTSGYTATVRPPVSYTDGVKAERLRAYGYSQPMASFELDHLIPLELGGAPRAVANLWPEPWEKSGLVPEGWGAETKDQFENYLHRAVCSGRVTLADAQRQMAGHWIGAAKAAGIAAGTDAPTSTSTTAAPATTTPAGGDQGVVHAGAFCSPEGATGKTSTGKQETCTTSPTDDRDRWR